MSDVSTDSSDDDSAAISTTYSTSRSLPWSIRSVGAVDIDSVVPNPPSVGDSTSVPVPSHVETAVAPNAPVSSYDHNNNINKKKMSSKNRPSSSQHNNIVKTVEITPNYDSPYRSSLFNKKAINIAVVTLIIALLIVTLLFGVHFVMKDNPGLFKKRIKPAETNNNLADWTQSPSPVTSSLSPSISLAPSKSIFPSKTPSVSSKPSTNPTHSPTAAPTAWPSSKPSTTSPSTSMAPIITPYPTAHPTTPFPTSNPTAHPTALPTSPKPTPQPTNPTLTFFVMGDTPYDTSDAEKLIKQIAEIPPSTPFVYHLGDLNRASRTDCAESAYIRARNILRQSPSPLFVTPGDNDWNDCPDPDQAWTYWYRHFGPDFVGQNWNGHGIDVKRQSNRRENVAFLLDFVLFVGVNLVGGSVHDEDEWQRRLSDDLEWVLYNMYIHDHVADSVVIFGHARPREEHDAFFVPLVKESNFMKKKILYLHGDGHKFQLDETLTDDAEYIMRVQVDKGGRGAPLKVTVTSGVENPFAFDRRSHMT